MIKKIQITILLVLAAMLQLSAQKPDDFMIKGFHIDMRTEVMTMPALKEFATDLASLGINTIIMEWEASFPFQDNATLCNQYAYTADEVKSFINHCSKTGIDVVPLQNCFGHAEYILRHERYAHLKEDKKEVSQVCPLKISESKEVFESIFGEIVKRHPSKYFHIGCDETYLLGSCKQCAEVAAKDSKSRLFVDYVNAMCDIVRSLGKQPVMWADIILKNPEAAKELPKDLIFMDWNYGWKINHFGDLDNLLNEGFTFWGAPSIRSHPDNIFLTQWEKHFNNQRDFIPYSRNAGYNGIVMTSWSTSGIYGFEYEDRWEVVDMYPVRYVYPISGFRILIAAYGESLKSNEPLDPEIFVRKYGKERFGLSDTESQVLWDMIKMEQAVVRGSKYKNEDIDKICAEAINIKQKLEKLKPVRNAKEIEHFKLMLDIRIEHLDLCKIENIYQSPSFNISKASEVFAVLKSSIDRSPEISERFFKLNKGFLHDEELNRINHIRTHRMNIMYETIGRLADKNK